MTSAISSSQSASLPQRRQRGPLCLHPRPWLSSLLGQLGFDQLLQLVIGNGTWHQLVADKGRRGALHAEQGTDAQAVAQLFGGLACGLEGQVVGGGQRPC